jgi:hypothetical protein
MDSVEFWVFLWSISTLSLNKTKLKLNIGFFCLAYSNALRLQKPCHDLI